MAPSVKKAALRKVLLEKRDAISDELVRISSEKIFKKLGKIKEFRAANTIACYYPTGSEVKTQDIMLDALSQGKQVCLPRITKDDMEFFQIPDLNSIEQGAFGIMEPKESCKACSDIDVIIVPTVGIAKDGTRLGYGHGYYDRFLAKYSATSIAITYSKQMVKSIPTTPNDITVNWIVTEDKIIKVA